MGSENLRNTIGAIPDLASGEYRKEPKAKPVTIITDKPFLTEYYFDDNNQPSRLLPNKGKSLFVDFPLVLFAPYGENYGLIQHSGNGGWLEHFAVPFVVKLSPGGTESGRKYFILTASVYEAPRYRLNPMQAIIADNFGRGDGVVSRRQNVPTEASGPVQFESIDFVRNGDESFRVLHPLRVYQGNQLSLVRHSFLRGKMVPQFVLDLVVHDKGSPVSVFVNCHRSTWNLPNGD